MINLTTVGSHYPVKEWATKSWQSFTRWLTRVKQRSQLDRSIVHFAPHRGRLVAILLLALLITAFFYGLVLQNAYSGISDAIGKANVVQNSLRTLPNYPIGPKDATGDRQLLGDKIETAAAFEVLRAWGVFGRNVQIGELLKGTDKFKEEKRVLDTLIKCNNKGGEIPATLQLVRCTFPEFGGADETGVASNCLWSEAKRALAGYPGSSDSLLETMAAHLSGDRKTDCLAHSDDRKPLSFAFHWFSSNRDYEGILRALLFATRTLDFPPKPVEVENSGGAQLPSWWHFSNPKRRFLTETISRLDTDQAVRSARSWLVLWRGPEQFFLIFTAVVLILLFGDRIRQRRFIKKEADRVLAALHRALDIVQKKTDREKRSSAAKKLADDLENARDENEMSQFVPGVRRDSVVIYMAEKAVRRIVIEPREPELFRQTCDGINAEVERSGWILRYASRALPAIGFIGTVRGIMLALPAAQGLFGTTGSAQVAALNNVIEPLGLAFATTLIALVAGLVTGLLGDWEVAREQMLLSRIEESLIDRIDPAEA